MNSVGLIGNLLQVWWLQTRETGLASAIAQGTDPVVKIKSCLMIEATKIPQSFIILKL
jgi:hypothetical protein